MRRLVCCICLLAFVLVNSHSAVESRLASLPTTYVMAAGANPAEDSVPLPFDMPLTGTLAPRSSAGCSLGETQYAIQYPGGATRIKLQISVASPQSAGGLLVYARFGQRVVVNDRGPVFDFASAGTVPLYFPKIAPHLFEAGTYYIALSNCGLDPLDFTIRASLLSPPDADTVPLTDETSFGAIPPAAPDSCSLSQTQYQVVSLGGGPCGGIIVSAGAQSDQTITLYARLGQRVAVENGQIVADLASTFPGRSQSITLSSAGTYYVAVGNCSTATANYVLSTGQIIVDVFDFAIVNGCQLLREPNGTFVLMVFGANFKGQATVTVGGVTPKKVKFVELEPGSTTTYRAIRLVKKFCGRLPGNIIVTNPGPCPGASSPFFCNERCPD